MRFVIGCLNCTIKGSLDTRLDNSKAFVLIVGEHTKRLTAGKCFESCDNYSKCSYGKVKKNFSYLQFECDGAASRFNDTDLPRIIVLYKDTKVDKSKCLDSVKDVALAHATMIKKDANGNLVWDYQSVKKAFDTL